MKYYSNEIVFRGHPDKCCDQISAAILTECVKQDAHTRAGIETVGGKGKIFVTGEITTNAIYDVEKIVKNVLLDVGYSTDYEIIDNIGKQSPDISQGVDIGGAGDNGMMFGYACDDTPEMLPTAMVILQKFAEKYDEIRKALPDFFYPDGKAQITGEYDDNFRLKKIKTFTICYQNCETCREETDEIMRIMALNICEEYNIEVEKFLINPTGKFLIGGFEGDSGLTGRKIVVDAYQSFANVGGGCVDCDTEYLTPSGWKRINEFLSTDLVGQWDNGALEFVKPISYIKTNADKMYYIHTSSSIDMVLSEHHNVLYRTSKNNFIKKEWKDIYNEYLIKDSGARVEIPLWFTNSFNYNSGLNWTKEDIQLQIALCADGHIISLSTDSKRQCRVRVKKQYKIDRMRYLLKTTHTDYIETKDNLYSIFWYNPKILSKSIYDCFKNCNKKEAEIICKEILQWDGNRENKYRTTIKKDADFAQFLFSSIYGVYVSIVSDNRIGQKYQKYIRKSICYDVYIGKYKYSNCFRKNIKYYSNLKISEFKPKDGLMYCINVPSHNLILRRNNRIFITGNCMNGKDMTKVDVSGAYKARQLAKRFLKEYNLRWCQVQLSYSIGIAEPMAVYVNSDKGDIEVGAEIYEECKPRNIIKDLKLLEVDYRELAKFGHFRD